VQANRDKINQYFTFLCRIHDVSRSGFNDWAFMTVQQWGESPKGTWELEIHNKGRYMGELSLPIEICEYYLGLSLVVREN
jgi:hypothetical protein